VSISKIWEQTKGKRRHEDKSYKKQETELQLKRGVTGMPWRRMGTYLQDSHTTAADITIQNFKIKH
jgi:hypothetical protein